MIVGLLIRKRLLALIRCLHLTDPTTYTLNKNDSQYDKMHQMRDLIEKIRQVWKRMWKIGQFNAIDDSMVRYKGKYCLVGNTCPKIHKMESKGVVCGGCKIQIHL